MMKKTTLTPRDYWSDKATWNLIEVWGKKHAENNRGKVTTPEWSQVAKRVNRLNPGEMHTMQQCRRKLDNLKTKLREERAKGQSDWPFFRVMDMLIGSNTEGNEGNIEKDVPSIDGTQQKSILDPKSSLKRKRPVDWDEEEEEEEEEDEEDEEEEDVPNVDGTQLKLVLGPKSSLKRKRPGDWEEEEEEDVPLDPKSSVKRRRPGDWEEKDEEEEEEMHSDGHGLRALATAIKNFQGVYEKAESNKFSIMTDMNNNLTHLVNLLDRKS